MIPLDNVSRYLIKLCAFACQRQFVRVCSDLIIRITPFFSHCSPRGVVPVSVRTIFGNFEQISEL